MDSTTFFAEWMFLAKDSTNIHEEAANFYKMWADSCMLTSIILSTAGGSLNIILGSVDPLVFVFAHIGLGAVVLTSTALLTISKQLKLDELVIKHQEYSARFEDLHRVIQDESVLLTMNDSSYANREDFLKIIENELRKSKMRHLARPDLLLNGSRNQATFSHFVIGRRL